jgi:uncharacterized membrane protein
MLLTRRQLLRAIDGARIKQAIAEAERGTTGEIRVSVAPFFWGNVHRVAELAFERLGMRSAPQHNAVLFFVVPSRRSFTVLGDEGIHARVGEEFWSGLTADMAKRFRGGDFTGGLVHGIETVGRELAAHFPAAPSGHVNVLPDDVDFGPG